MKSTASRRNRSIINCHVASEPWYMVPVRGLYYDRGCALFGIVCFIYIYRFNSASAINRAVAIQVVYGVDFNSSSLLKKWPTSVC
jgi:hypothetical protein